MVSVGLMASRSPLDPQQVSRGVCVAALALCALAASVSAVAVGEPSYLVGTATEGFAALRFADGSDEGKRYNFDDKLPSEENTGGIMFTQVFASTEEDNVCALTSVGDLFCK